MFDDVEEMFEEIERMMREEFEELSRKAPKELVRERTLPDGTKAKSWGPFVYGYSVTVGPKGEPRIREFGNIKPGKGPRRTRIGLKERREPLVDIIEADGELEIVAELPGVEKRDIKLHGTEESLTISVDTPQRSFHKKVELPTQIDPQQAKSTYKNGVLTITVPKREEKKPEGEPIEIE